MPTYITVKPIIDLASGKAVECSYSQLCAGNWPVFHSCLHQITEVGLILLQAKYMLLIHTYDNELGGWFHSVPLKTLLYNICFYLLNYSMILKTGLNSESRLSHVGSTSAKPGTWKSRQMCCPVISNVVVQCHKLYCLLFMQLHFPLHFRPKSSVCVWDWQRCLILPCFCVVLLVM